MLNNDGQPVISRFNQSRNKDKAMLELLGMLNGLLTDEIITPMDMVFLDAWLKDQHYLLDDPDVAYLIKILDDILAKERISEREKSYVITIIQSIIECRDEYLSIATNQDEVVHRCLGILRGIVADQTITDGELLGLYEWLNSVKDIEELWPLNDIQQQVGLVIEAKDNQDMRNELLIYFNKVVGNEFYETGSASASSTGLPIDDIDCIDIKGKIICFTGKFSSGTRRECEDHATNNGAFIAQRITKSLEVLVIGDNASRDWIHSSFGRKIQKVIEYKNDGQDIKIISETVFLSSVKL